MTPLAAARFAVTMLAALSLSVAVGTFLQLPARQAWDQFLWVGATTQGGFFGLSGTIGILLQIAALIGLLVLALLLPRTNAQCFSLVFAAALLFAAGLIVWWLTVYPANVEMAKWVNGPVPDDWMHWRTSWEGGQAANGVLQLAGFAALIASLLAKPTPGSN